MKIYGILEITTTNTQAAAAECGAEQAIKRYFFVAKNHNSKQI
jgi:hypothetical protein